MGRKRQYVMSRMENIKGRVQGIFKKPRVDNEQGNRPLRLLLTLHLVARRQFTDRQWLGLIPGMGSFQTFTPDAMAPVHASPHYHHEFRIEDQLEPEPELYTMPDDFDPDVVGDVEGSESEKDGDDESGDGITGTATADASKHSRKAREAPTQLMASAALKDLRDKRRSQE